MARQSRISPKSTTKATGGASAAPAPSAARRKVPRQRPSPRTPLSPFARELLTNARSLLHLHPDADITYLEARVSQETDEGFGADDVAGEG
ncbi:hypothetical protein M2335_002641 [Sphingobium sp. B12D2B]|nr:hypothetical protein [Sphingobium sp. B12D2B]